MNGLPKSFRSIENIQENDEDISGNLPPSFKKTKKINQKEKLKDIGKQIFKKGTASGLGSYGNLLDLIHAQTKERMTPGQEALTRAEFEAPESLLPFLQDEDILPRYSRLPSQKEAETFIEMLGGPREAETEAGRIAGRSAEFAGGALPFGAGGNLLKLLASVGAGGQLAREIGAPESVATGIEMIPLAQAGYQIGKAAKGTKVPVKKPSGMPVRKFEGLKKATPVFEETGKRTRDLIEQDFRNLTSDLLKKTNKSYEAIIEDPEFKQKIGSLFGKVKESASEFTEPIIPKNMAKNLTKEIDGIGKKGISLSDSEKVQRSLLNKFRKDIVNKEVTAEQLLDQYRKNNDQLSKLYPYGDKALENIGKREALESYNRIIADTIEENFPNSEFSNLFKFTNQRWSELKKIETVDKYLNALFGKDKIAFNQAEKIFTDPKAAERLKNAIGKEGFENFKQINKDLLSQRNAIRLLKSKNYHIDDLSKGVAAYMLEPSLAKLKFGKDFITKLYRRTLSDPKMIRNWKDGLRNLRKGKVIQAISQLNTLSKKSEQD